MLKYFFVSLGAGIGGAFRYWLSGFVHNVLPAYFPFGTLAVNILGSFILGIIIFYFDENELISQNIKLLLTVGFCGGFTTFSTFSLETINLMRESELILAFFNILLNILLCLVGVYVAYILSK